MLGARYLVEDLNARRRGEDASGTSGDVAATPWPDIDETALTFLGNASLKALGISALYDGLVLSDDSGLEVDALNGEPGVRSARFAGETATDSENRELLLGRLIDFRGKERVARFRCVMVLAQGNRILGDFSGTVEGTIINQEKGDHGFGYESLFVPEGFCETFAQLPSETKNQLSHRARALQQVIRFLATLK